MKSRYICLFAVCLMATALTGCGSISDEVSSVVSTVREKLGQTESDETELQEGQRYANIQVVSITGNELTYYEIEEETEEESESETEEATETVTEAAAEGETEGGAEVAAETETELVETDADSAETGESDPDSDIANSSNNMPDTSDMPDMGDFDMDDFNMEDFDMSDMDMSSIAEMFSSGDMPDMSSAGDSADFSDFDFGSTDQETETVYLQVGVVVHTGTDNKTFSILEEGDELKVLFETDDDGNEVIAEMWLTSTSTS